jgi:hypothetical protein
MAKLPKSIIKKYGISKKAWAVFRGNKRTTTKIKVRGHRNMARHRYRSYHRRKSTGGKFMTGLIKPSGIIAGAVLGLGAAALSEYVPVNIPYKQTIAAFAVGGVPGAVAQMLAGNLNAGSSSGFQLY